MKPGQHEGQGGQEGEKRGGAQATWGPHKGGPFSPLRETILALGLVGTARD